MFELPDDPALDEAAAIVRAYAARWAIIRAQAIEREAWVWILGGYTLDELTVVEDRSDPMSWTGRVLPKSMLDYSVKSLDPPAR